MLATEHLHPAVVHFPIVLICVLLCLDLHAWLTDRPLGGTAAAVAVAAGLTAGLAAMLGDAAAEIAMGRGVPDAVIEGHEGLGTTAAILLAILALVRAIAWWRAIPLAGGRRTALVGIEAAILALVVVTAWYGGELVYRHGVNVEAAPG